MGVPPHPWRGPVCTYGRAGTDAVRTRAREKRKTKRTTDLPLLLPIARGAFCFAFLARTWPCAIAVVGSVAARPTEKVSFWWFRGGGHVPHFRDFWGTNAGTVRAVPMRATFGQKIFFDRMAVSSRRSSTEGYQNEFFSDVCSLSRAQSAHVRSPPGDSRSTKSTSRRQV